MAPNQALIFNEVPDGWPIPGQHLVTKDIDFDPDAPAPANGLTLEIAYLSFDPYMRGRMRPSSVESYFPAFDLHAPITNNGIARVLKSNVSHLSPGDIVQGFLPFQEYLTLDEKAAKRVTKLENPHKIDTKYFLGALGMPGLTAYSSLYEIGKPKKGETIFISAASGAVGQIVGQLAKHEGLKVIGSVGSQEKLDYITKTLGFDGGFNYKEEKPGDALSRLAPDGIDIYYENVGGEQLDAALVAANYHARFVMCGMISQYSAKPDEVYGVKNLMLVVGKRLLLQGFIQGDENMGPKYQKERNENVGKWIADGTLKVTQSETKGMENAAEGFIGMLKGQNFGKAILVVKEL